MPVDLDAVLRAAVRDVLPDVADRVDLGHWRPDGAGRWSSPAPRRLAAAARMPLAPLAVRLAGGLTTALVERLAPLDGGGEVEVTGDGFLLVTPSVADLRAIVAAVLAAGPAYARPAGTVSPLTVDPTVPQRRTPSNPLFVVMWAHARCCVHVDRATADGRPDREPLRAAATAPPSSGERVFVLLLADLPRAVAAAGDDPAVVLRRLHEVARAIHHWLDEPDADAPEAGRLALVHAAGQVLATGLDVLGLPAPTRC